MTNDSSIGQIQDIGTRKQLVLFTEAHSRFGDRGILLFPSELSNDNLCRVIVDYVDHAQTDELNLSTISYTQLIGLGLRELCSSQARLWCIGEIHRKKSEELRYELGDRMAVVQADTRDDLVVYHINAADIDEDASWPSFVGDYGFRIFAFDEKLTEFEGVLAHIYETVSAKPYNAIKLWNEIRARCYKRKSLAALCNDMLVGVLPDGPHFTEVAFHSTLFRVEQISASLCSVAHNYGLGCYTAENKSNEWQRFTTRRFGSSA